MQLESIFIFEALTMRHSGIHFQLVLDIIGFKVCSAILPNVIWKQLIIFCVKGQIFDLSDGQTNKIKLPHTYTHHCERRPQSSEVLRCNHSTYICVSVGDTRT